MHEEPQIKPKARTEDLLIEELDDGIVVYDRRNDSAHWLDSAAAVVWRTSNGELVAAELAVQCGLSEQQVAEVLERLEGIDLMVEPGVSRRTALRRIARIGGTAVVLAPVISSIAVPVALANSSQCAKVDCTVTEGNCASQAQAQIDGTAKCRTAGAIAAGCQASSTCVLAGTCTTPGHTYAGTCTF